MVGGGAGGGAAGGGPLREVTINFDELGDPTDVAAQYSPAVTFSTMAGQLLQSRAFGGSCRTSEPNVLVAGPSGVFDAPVYLEFSAPVSGLRFRIGCVQSSGVIARVRLVRSGQPEVVQDVMGMGDVFELDLSAHTGVTRLEIFEIADAAGLAYDDFRFLAP